MSNIKVSNPIETREYKHQNKERLCYCCDTLQPIKEMIHKLGFSNHSRGYGSDFDNENIEIQLCSNCYKDEYKEWFNETPKIEDSYCEIYKHEDDIYNLIKTFLLENQEYALNHIGNYHMERQDWIDMENKTLPDEKYKEYGMYSPSECKSYEERFPTCHYPVNRVYNDASKGCWCPFEAYGDEGQKAGINISSECHYCDYFKLRETSIKDIKDEHFEDYKLYIKSSLKQNELFNKFNNL